MKRRKESGFALLLIFLMAAVIAISLYMEIPRVAFESQRQKEQLLVDRGEQYKRAIQMFMKANNRWPAKIEELESFNNRRFLRKRFIDPMTGEEKWRFIHIQNGVLIDSLVNKAKQGQAGGSVSGLVAEIPVSTGDLANGQQVVNIAQRRRASDGNPTGAPGGDPNNPNPQTGYPPGQQPYPGATTQPGQTYPPGVVPIPGMPGIPGQPVDPNQAQYPAQAQQYPGQTQQYPGQPAQYPGQPQQYPGQPVQYPGQPQQYPGQTQQYPGQPQQYPGLPGMPVNSQGGGVSPTPYPTTPGANGNPPGFGQPGLGAPQGSNQAAQMIQQILTSPRPGGMPNATGSQLTIGGGIAGVASNADSEAIMVINDKTNYKEWEFVFDPTKVKPVPNPLTGALGKSAADMGTPASQLGNMPGQQIGTPIGQQPGAQQGQQPGFPSGQGMNPVTNPLTGH